MAYKFQLGAATLSGSTTFEESLVAKQSFEAQSLSSSAGLQVGGTVRLDGVIDATAADADKLLFRDSDSLIKAESVSDLRDLYFDDVSGQATIAAGGALSLAAAAITGQTEMTGDVEDADELMISDGGTLKRLDFSVLRDAVFNDVSGDATVAAGGALTIGANAVEDSMVNDNVATGLAGNGLAASSGVMAIDLDGSNSGLNVVAGGLSVDLNILAGGAVDVSADSIAIIDDNDGQASKKESIADLMTAVAGVGLGASGGVLAVQVSGAIVLDNDRLGLSGSLAADGLTFAGGPESISSLRFDAHSSGGLTDNVASSGQAGIAFSAMGEANVAVADDFFMFADGGGTGAVKKESIADLMTAVAGNGLAASSGVLSMDASELAEAAVANGDFIVIEDATDNSTKKEAVADLATLFAGTGLAAASAVLSIDLDELGAAAVDVAADSIAIIDATDDSTKKESIADLVSGMAGAGLTATSGQLSVTGNNVALKADGDTLAEGYNYFADASSNATVTLPASPSVGDVVVVKARDLTSGAKIIINRQGSHTIDGQNSVEIESPFGAITCVYVVANDWRIV